MNEIWTLTDASTNQYGRKISEFLFEFKEDGKDQRIIDLKRFNYEKIENAINAFGYSLSNTNPKFTYLYDEYAELSQWIIAECLFELDEKENTSNMQLSISETV